MLEFFLLTQKEVKKKVNSCFLLTSFKGIQEIVNFNLKLTSSQMYKNWFPGGILQGFLFKSGLFDTSPTFEQIKKHINPENIKRNGRRFITGAHSLSDAEFIQFNETSSSEDLLKVLTNFFKLFQAIYASGAIPSIFPAVQIGSKHFIDGGVSYMNPVSKAIRACYQLGAKEVHVDVVMAIGDVVEIPSWIGRTTPFVLGKTLFGVLSNFFLRFVSFKLTPM
jgi:predicted acylesterase/phospholipase RssA